MFHFSHGSHIHVYIYIYLSHCRPSAKIDAKVSHIKVINIYIVMNPMVSLSCAEGVGCILISLALGGISVYC